MTETPEMVERVARAIAESHEGRDWDRMMDHGRDWWRQSARAAIQAMREPTEGMLASVADARDPFLRIGCQEAWRSMIDAALGTEGKTDE